mmetsp:Transcript_15382/g.41166  ORF Transcript_15382/g.41166 Transcript_15382/m.41166 type:complete len:293 (+) Transcript_15382:311-1189(+)
MDDIPLLPVGRIVIIRLHVEARAQELDVRAVILQVCPLVRRAHGKVRSLVAENKLVELPDALPQKRDVHQRDAGVAWHAVVLVQLRRLGHAYRQVLPKIRQGELPRHDCVGVEEQAILHREVKRDIDTLPGPQVIPLAAVQVAGLRVAREAQALDLARPLRVVLVHDDAALEQPSPKIGIARANPMVQHMDDRARHNSLHREYGHLQQVLARQRTPLGVGVHNGDVERPPSAGEGDKLRVIPRGHAAPLRDLDRAPRRHRVANENRHAETKKIIQHCTNITRDRLDRAARES